MERTRKYKEDRCLLITTKVGIYRTQQETGQALRKYFHETMTVMKNSSRPN